MHGFADETYIDLSSGAGGPGCVSFRREKYIPRGGPDGGDGGRGGNVVFVVRPNTKTLLHLKRRRCYRAENGRGGEGCRRHGADGADVLIPVPPGTLIRDPVTGQVLRDLAGEDRWIFLEGGRGGKGNCHFKTSTRQTPRFAQPGTPGVSCRVHVELNLIADVGLVGMPNAGKSSLVAALTQAKTKVGDYPFTTLVPSLGVLRRGDSEIVFADIPGIIEGAGQGAGLGLKFLKHIARTRVLVFLIDLSGDNFLESFGLLQKELRGYPGRLLDRPRIVAGSKLDLPGAPERLEELRRALPGERVAGLSNFTREGLEGFLDLCLELAGTAQAPEGD
ncbi:MAG: GTPase ObgE [Spirochaetales bacterium]|jgi:GTP-binding protein|nr:GTPase ObgE [Spirochaetales bacterium]